MQNIFTPIDPSLGYILYFPPPDYFCWGYLFLSSFNLVLLKFNFGVLVQLKLSVYTRAVYSYSIFLVLVTICLRPETILIHIPSYS